MSDPSRTFDQLTFEDLASVTSLPESGSGPGRYETRESPTTIPFGPDHAHANLSARQAKELGLQTSGTYGQHSIGSFGNAAPERSLANRLRVVTDIHGSTLFKLTWKRNTTPSGRSIFALRASARPTSGNGCTGVGTPTAKDDQQSSPNAKAKGRLKHQVAKFSNLATPTSNDAKSNQHRNETSRNPGMNLNDHAQMFEDFATDSGQTPNGSSAATESTGQLNPCYSRWLMGLPIEWEFAAFRASENLKARKSSSRSSTKRSVEPSGSEAMETPSPSPKRRRS